MYKKIISIIASGLIFISPLIFAQSFSTIHVKSQWKNTYIVIGENKVEMKKEPESKGWWSVTVPLNKAIEFSFEDGARRKIDLGGTMGNYPGDPIENFKTSYKEIWVKDGLIFTQNPEKPNPKSDEISVLTVNLHTYQERDQQAKIERVAAAIATLKIDIVVLQEVAQHKDSEIAGKTHGILIKKDNMAKIIVDILKEKYAQDYNFFWDWSHYGWDVWEEGSAILTKHEITQVDSHYITKNKTKTFWKSRNVPFAQVKIPDYGLVNVYSIHMGWWNDKEEPFKFMFNNLLLWNKEQQNDKVKFSIFSGDFNNEAGSIGYDHIVKAGQLDDMYLKANPTGFLDPTIGGKIDGWKEGNAKGKRIDFLFTPKSNNVKVKIAQRIFTENSFGRVSDHNGQYFILKK